MTRILTTWLLLIVAGAGSARAEWYNFNPQGSEDGKGILHDVVSRCDAQGKQIGYDADLVTRCHESTHMLNSRIRASAGGGNLNAFYCGAGKCCVLPEPRTTISHAAQFVPANLRNSTFQLYFVSQSKDWNNQPLYIFDEWSAYCNGLQAAQELRVNEHGERDRAFWFCTYADCVVEAIKRDDPNYAKMAELLDFVKFQKTRVANMLGVNAEQFVKQCGSCGSCGMGGCGGGMCGPQMMCGPGGCSPMGGGRQIMPDGGMVISRPVVPSQPSGGLTPVAQPDKPSGFTSTDDWKQWCEKDLERQKILRDKLDEVLAKPGCQCDNGAVIAAIQSIPRCQCKDTDLTEVNNKLDAILAAVSKPQTPAPTPAPAPLPAHEQHVAIVADKAAGYWPRMSQEVTKTQQVYSGIQVYPLPDFPIGEIPQAVIYEDRVPIATLKGERDVLDLLSRLSRGLQP